MNMLMIYQLLPPWVDFFSMWIDWLILTNRYFVWIQNVFLNCWEWTDSEWTMDIFHHSIVSICLNYHLVIICWISDCPQSSSIGELNPLGINRIHEPMPQMSSASSSVARHKSASKAPNLEVIHKNTPPMTWNGEEVNTPLIKQWWLGDDLVEPVKPVEPVEATSFPRSDVILHNRGPRALIHTHTKWLATYGNPLLCS